MNTSGVNSARFMKTTAFLTSLSAAGMGTTGEEERCLENELIDQCGATVCIRKMNI